MNQFVRVLIKDKNDRLLVVRHCSGSEFFWNFPGGKIEAGESPADAAHREVFEEIGITILRLKYLKSKTCEISGKFWKGYFYFAKEFMGTPYLKEPTRIDNLIFKSRKELHVLPSISLVLADIGNSKLVSMKAPSIFNPTNNIFKGNSVEPLDELLPEAQ